MRDRRPFAAITAAISILALIAVLVSTSNAGAQPNTKFSHDYATPVFGVNSQKMSARFFAADYGSGIVRVTRGRSAEVLPMLGVMDVHPINGNKVFAITGEPPEEGFGPADQLTADPQSVYAGRTRTNSLRKIADLGAYEEANNTDGGKELDGSDNLESNPHRLVKVGPNLAVADAAANAVLAVNIASGAISPMAIFPPELVDATWLQEVLACPNPEFADICGLPAMIPAEAVPTAIAEYGGYVYVGELKGFPASAGNSKIWRFPVASRGLTCGVDAECELVAEGLTSIIDMNFTSTGKLAVGEVDRAGWLAMEQGQGVGGAVKLCDVDTGSCRLVRQRLQMLTAIAVGRGDRIYAMTFGLVPGAAQLRLVGKA